MITKELRNEAGIVIGTVNESDTGLYSLYDNEGKYIATYNPFVHSTYDPHGRFIGYGDMLHQLAEANARAVREKVA